MKRTHTFSHLNSWVNTQAQRFHTMIDVVQTVTPQKCSTKYYGAPKQLFQWLYLHSYFSVQILLCAVWYKKYYNRVETWYHYKRTRCHVFQEMFLIVRANFFCFFTEFDVGASWKCKKFLIPSKLGAWFGNKVQQINTQKLVYWDESIFICCHFSLQFETKAKFAMDMQ